jgi:hypothetical protein
MNLIELVTSKLGWLHPGVAARLEQTMTAVPAVRQAIEQEYDSTLANLEKSVRPYRDDYPSFGRLPSNAVGREQLLEWIAAMGQHEQKRWQDGYASGAVYHGDPRHIDFLNSVYALHSQSNPLHAVPSAAAQQ